MTGEIMAWAGTGLVVVLCIVVAGALLIGLVVLAVRAFTYVMERIES